MMGGFVDVKIYISGMKKGLLICSMLMTVGAFAQRVNYPMMVDGFMNSEASTSLLYHSNDDVHILLLTDASFNKTCLSTHGARIQSDLHDIFSVLVPRNALVPLMSCRGVLAAELPSPSQSMRLQMDSARSVLGVNAIQDGTLQGLSQAYQGEDVIIGIVDVGFQHRHPAFLDSDSTTLRISRMWQQNQDIGAPPQGFSYGTEYIGKEEIYKDVDLHGTHGTHVAGIASGSGIGSPDLKYRGIAPKAELVFVSIKYYNDTIPGSAHSDYVIANPAIIDAYQYIFDYAQSVGKPAVINLSWGMHTGPHDGTSIFDLATDRLVGQGMILVGAAGNYGNHPMHFHHMLMGDSINTLVIEDQREQRAEEQVYVDVWGSGNSVFSMQVELVDTLGQPVYQTSFVETRFSGVRKFLYEHDSGNVEITLFVQDRYLPNQKPNILVWIHNHQLRHLYAGFRFTSPYCELHAWNSGGIMRYTSGRFVHSHRSLNLSSTHKAGNTQYTVGENGGTSRSVISVGATTAKNNYVGLFNDTFNNAWYSEVGAITPFSSRGPTADGRIKPDICAPGMDVAAPIYLRQYPGWAWNRLVAREGFLSDTFAYGVFSGTSMAAPQVTGVIALMLQANPSLNPLQIRHILAATATKDRFTGQVPNTIAGYGKVNAQAALLEAIRVVGVSPPSMPKTDRIIAYPNPANGVITVEVEGGFLTPVYVFDLKGKLWLKNEVDSGVKTTTLSLESLPVGVYLLKTNGQALRIAVF
jgi:minor extracellular serine protease Vpr